MISKETPKFSTWGGKRRKNFQSFTVGLGLDPGVNLFSGFFSTFKEVYCLWFCRVILLTELYIFL